MQEVWTSMSPRCSERATLENNFQMYGAVCKVFLPEPGFGPNRCRAVCIYIYGVVYVVWCGQVPRPHALKMFRYNPTRPPMSYESPMLHACVCVSWGCGQRVTMSKKIKQAKRGFYGHGWHFSVTNRSDLLEVNKETYFFSYTLEASVPWRTTPMRWDSWQIQISLKN